MGKDREPAGRVLGEVPARRGRGTVYAMADLERGLVKIGYTDGPVEKRRRGIESASGAELALLGCISGTRDDERSMHELFADHRVRGEWFRADEDVLDWACELAGVLS
jgi:Meiotically Up-regulated Gene 113 (MUG113) protein